LPHALSEPRPFLYLAIGLLWLVVGVGLAGTGRLEGLRPPAPQLIVLGLTFAVTLASTWARGLRRWVDSVPILGLISLHVTRLGIGIYFLQLARNGALASGFAVPAGWGDVAVGLVALGLLGTEYASRADRSQWYRAWNWLGLLDLLFVVLTAARIGLTNPGSMRGLLRLPLSVLPTFWVPLLIASHLILLRRLRSPVVAVASGTA
jgi:hypothetical protein